MDCLRRGMRYFILVLIVFISVSDAFSQKKKQRDTSSYLMQPNRLEFEMDVDGDYFHVVSGSVDGMLIIKESDRGTDGNHNWIFHLADTSLNMVWTRIFGIPADGLFVGYDYFKNHFYLLFNVSKYRSQDYLLLQINRETSAETRYEINTVFPITMTEFEVLENNAILGGYTNFRPVILSFNFEEKKPRVVPGFYENYSELQDLVTDDDYETFTTIQSERLNTKKFTIRAKTFTAQGDLIQDNMVQPGDNKNLIDGAATSFFGGFQYLAGTYSKKSNDYSRGLYLCKFVNGRQQLINYHDYSDLSNFFGFMNPKREQRVKERIEKKKEKGRKPNFSYRLLVHKIIQRGDEFILVAEAYYPRYTSYSNTSYGGMSSFNPSFLGYTYTHAIVVGFDRNGNILWDHSFEIDNADSYSLVEFVTVNVNDEEIVLSYLHNNVINTKFVKGHEIIEGKTFNPVRLAFEMDEVKSKNPEMEGLKNWYENTMYAYGAQRIQNDQGISGRASRYVFYVNKIQYQPEHAVN